MMSYKATLACVFAAAIMGSVSAGGSSVVSVATSSVASGKPFPTDVEPAFTQLTELSAKYGNTIVSPANEGIEIPVPQIASAPSFSTSTVLDGKNILIMIDPDVSTPQILHFLQPGMVSASGSTGDKTVPLSAPVAPAAPYLSPGPPAGTGAHRYTFFLFSQPKNFALSPSFNGSNRVGFNIVKFATEYGLGAPIAGTFYLAQFMGNGTTGSGSVNGTSSNSNGAASAGSSSAAASSTGNVPVSPSAASETGNDSSSSYVANFILVGLVTLVSVGMVSL